MSETRWIRRAVAIAGCAAALSLGIATPAVAAGTSSSHAVRPALLCRTQFVANGVRIHVSPSLSSTVVGLGYNGQWFDVQNIQFTNGMWWAHGTDESTGVTGYVDDQDGFLNVHECP